jgi:uncharacterized protein (TIGR02246 family)
MARRFSAICCGAALLLAGCNKDSGSGKGGDPPVPVPDSRAEEEAVRAVIVAITDAFNQHDAKAWTRLATSDAQLVTVRGESMNGVTEIEKGLTALFQGRNRNASVKILDVKIRFITPDVAIAHVTNELSGVVDAEGRTLPARRELSLRVFVKTGGVWRITAFHNTTLQP